MEPVDNGAFRRKDELFTPNAHYHLMNTHFIVPPKGKQREVSQPSGS
jgi:hypothetical protein